MEYIAQITDVIQVSPDDWEPIKKTIVLKDDVTIRELKEWAEIYQKEGLSLVTFSKLSNNKKENTNGIYLS